MLESIVNTSTPNASSSSVNEFDPSTSLSVAVIAVGSVMLRIWTACSAKDVTIA